MEKIKDTVRAIYDKELARFYSQLKERNADTPYLQGQVETAPSVLERVNRIVPQLKAVFADNAARFIGFNFEWNAKGQVTISAGAMTDGWEPEEFTEAPGPETRSGALLRSLDDLEGVEWSQKEPNYEENNMVYVFIYA